jgi:hypothetical protein
MVRLVIPIFDSYPWLASLPLSFIQMCLRPDANPREGVEQSKYVEEPQHHANDDDGVQDGLNAACHGNETIHQPQQDANDDQG